MDRWFFRLWFSLLIETISTLTHTHMATQLDVYDKSKPFFFGNTFSGVGKIMFALKHWQENGPINAKADNIRLMLCFVFVRLCFFSHLPLYDFAYQWTKKTRVLFFLSPSRSFISSYSVCFCRARDYTENGWHDNNNNSKKSFMDGMNIAIE